MLHVVQQAEQAEVSVDKARMSAEKGVKAAGRAAKNVVPSRPGGETPPSPLSQIVDERPTQPKCRKFLRGYTEDFGFVDPRNGS